MKTFAIIWFGQFASRVGTGMTRFALLIWVYEQTGSVTTMALLAFFSFLPFILVSPFAGVWIDRLDRRKIMLLADVGAGVMTVSLLLAYATGNLQIWHLYLAEAFASAFAAFQGPAYKATATVLLPKKHYARASALRSMAEWGAHVVSPFLASLFLAWLGITGVMFIDVATLLVALTTLFFVRFPQVSAYESGPAANTLKQFWKETRVGFGYIWHRPGLLGLMLIFTGINFIDAMTYDSLLPIMILARSGGNEMALASVQGALGTAGVVGALFISIWGGPKRKIHGSLAGAAFAFLIGGTLLAVARTVPAWVVAGCVTAIFIPFVSSSNDAIWQAKVAPAVQGRVLAVYGMVRQSMTPIGILLGSLVADRWMEPAMMPGGSLTPLFGSLVGTGPGAGMALMFLAAAVLGCAVSLSGYLFPAVRCVEDQLLDHDLNTVSTAVAVQPA
jgi:hypothetical protein